MDRMTLQKANAEIARSRIGGTKIDAPCEPSLEKEGGIASDRTHYKVLGAVARANSYLDTSSHQGSAAERSAARLAAMHAAAEVVTKLAALSVSKRAVTEESGEHKAWYDEAKEATLETLPIFLAKLAGLEHDYGTIVHATAAAAVAAAHAMDRSPHGGITGFQADCVKWEFLAKWAGVTGPARLLTFESMLYPHHADEFRTVLTPSAAEWLKNEATKKLAEFETGELEHRAHPAVVAHWRDLAKGWIPFGWSIALESKVVADSGAQPANSAGGTAHPAETLRPTDEEQPAD